MSLPNIEEKVFVFYLTVEKKRKFGFRKFMEGADYFGFLAEESHVSVCIV